MLLFFGFSPSTAMVGRVLEGRSLNLPRVFDAQGLQCVLASPELNVDENQIEFEEDEWREGWMQW